MENRKYCIFHIPNYIDKSKASGSSIRPVKMLEAFRKNGYHVDCVWGYGKERKKAIKRIKGNIRQGRKYDFLYSESSTMPTLLTEKDHFPRYPLLDFNFFKFCKKNGIKVGIFYRDVQWKFPFYAQQVNWIKRWFSIPLYKYDLYKYRKLIDVFYLPSLEMKKYLGEYSELLKKSQILMPGCDKKSLAEDKKDTEELHIFYVGGIRGIYDIKLFLKTVSGMDHIKVTLCCRKNEWETVSGEYKEYMTDNINVIHVSGEQLADYYAWADICSVYAGIGEYFSMAMPVKVFEYLSYLKPMLGVKGTVSGDFIEENDIGWAVDYKEDKLKECILDILQHKDRIKEKKKQEMKLREKCYWEVRAAQVINNLK